MLIRTYDLPGVKLMEYDNVIHTLYPDGTESRFAPPKDNGEFAAAANEMGYSDLMRYAVEHELAHHVVAHARGKQHSLVVWADAHNSWSSFEGAEWPERADDEEHLANRLQRFAMLGMEDQYGCLRGVFGEGLNGLAKAFLLMARPWLTSEESV